MEVVLLYSEKCENPESLSNIYKNLIETNPKEQMVQEFIENNTHLLPREFIQNHGLHFDLCLRKVPLGSDYITDFMYLSKSSVSWNCVLIEIEKPQSKYFRKDSTKYHGDFVSALQQMNDWRAWFSSEENKKYFFNNSISFLKTPIINTPINIKYVLVHGRRSETEKNEIRLRKINSEQRDDFKIMSFDSLSENIKSKDALYIGVKKNNHIEIQSDKFVGESLFSWLEPDMIKINDNLATDMENFRGKINTFHPSSPKTGGKSIRTIDYFLDERMK